jgi:hypothetical protein
VSRGAFVASVVTRAARGLPVATCVLLLAACFGTTTGSSGISAPTGPTLAEFGLRERCVAGGDLTCSERALEVAGRALAQLGPKIPDDGDGADALVGLVVQVDRDPPWPWRAGDGNSGVVGSASFDLTSFVTGEGDAHVRLNGVAGAYLLPDEAAQAMVEALWVRAD